jgi:hypothetical protein
MRSLFFERIKSSGAPVIPLIAGPAVEVKILNYNVSLTKKENASSSYTHANSTPTHANQILTYANELLTPANVTLTDVNSFYAYAN